MGDERQASSDDCSGRYILEQERQQDPVMYWSRTRRYLLIPDEERLVQEVAVVL